MPGAADHFEFLVGFCVRSFSREKSQVKRTVPITWKMDKNVVLY